MSKSNNETTDRPSVEEEQTLIRFESRYSQSNKDGEGLPWAHMKPHPCFSEWLRRNPLDGEGRRALVVGCGMGDDAVELEGLGFQVTAFDVSTSAIAYCRERFPHSDVDFLEADLLADHPQWFEKFDFVLEIHTVQALPPKYEQELIQSITGFVAPKGQLVVVADMGKTTRAFDDGPPWLLTPEQIESFTVYGLTIHQNFIEKNTWDDDTNIEHVSVTTFSKSGA